MAGLQEIKESYTPWSVRRAKAKESGARLTEAGRINPSTRIVESEEESDTTMLFREDRGETR